jgi:MerR family mercuric resistance operon transcriptional regulator
MQPVTDKRGASLSIGALSQQTGVHIETIRYYERVKMLAAPPRTGGGRRVYDHSHRRTLGFIRRARDLGFSLDEIRALLDLDGSGRASCAEVREIANRHLASVRAKLADLARLETVLSETVGQCEANMTPVCPVLGILDPEPR